MRAPHADKGRASRDAYREGRKLGFIGGSVDVFLGEHRDRVESQRPAPSWVDLRPSRLMNIRHWRTNDGDQGPWTVVETEVYLRSAERIMDAEERAGLVDYLASHPLVGDLIPGAGGIRKVRVPLTGRGKRGGGRVLTFCVKDKAVYLLLAYAKNEQTNLTSEQARLLARLVETLF